MGKILTGMIVAFFVVMFTLLTSTVTVLVLSGGRTTPSYPGPSGNDLHRGDKAVTAQNSVGSGTVRTVTAYNVGDRKQTHSKPCIGASGDNLCTLLKKGIKVCAANFVPLRSKLHVERIGECVVLDRMNARFGSRVDFAMEKGQRNRAVKFGVQRLSVIESEDQGGEGNFKEYWSFVDIIQYSPHYICSHPDLDSERREISSEIGLILLSATPMDDQPNHTGRSDEWIRIDSGQK